MIVICTWTALAKKTCSNRVVWTDWYDLTCSLWLISAFIDFSFVLCFINNHCILMLKMCGLLRYCRLNSASWRLMQMFRIWTLWRLKWTILELGRLCQNTVSRTLLSDLKAAKRRLAAARLRISIFNYFARYVLSSYLKTLTYKR